MKTQIFAFILALGISIGFNPRQTYAQSTNVFRIEVPFAFSANNITLPAGTYIVNPASDSRLMWRIQSAIKNLVHFFWPEAFREFRSTAMFG